MNILALVRQSPWTRYLLAKLQTETDVDLAAQRAMDDLMKRLRPDVTEHRAA